MNHTLRDLFVAHHHGLIRMAGLLVDDAGVAEEVVQEAYVKLAGGLPRLRSDEAAVFYLRRTVMNLSKSRLRRRRTAERHVAAPLGHADAADVGALRTDERAAVITAVRALPARQQQCLVLRYYGGLTDTEVAASVGISLGSAKTHLRRGLATLAQRLEDRR